MHITKRKVIYSLIVDGYLIDTFKSYEKLEKYINKDLENDYLEIEILQTIENTYTLKR